MKLKPMVISLIFMFGTGSLFAQKPYSHDPLTTEELRVRDGLPNFFQKLKAGEKVKVGYIGGSITNGGMWRNKLLDWLKSEYPNAEISQVNAAMGGTGPDFGACRIGEHLLVHHPDIVFIEYRVNNGGAYQGRALEGLIPQIWRMDPNTDICIVYTIARGMIPDIQQGKQSNAGKSMEPVANHYGITSIEFGLEVVKQMNEGRLIFQGKKPKDGKILFSKDGTHPIEAGHDIYRDVLVRSLKKIESHGTPGPHIIPPPLKEKTFSNACMLPITAAEFSGAWKPVDLSEYVDIHADLTDKNDGVRPQFGAAVETDRIGDSFTLNWNGFMLGFTGVLDAKGSVLLEVTTDNGKPQIVDLASRSGKQQSKYIFTKEIESGSHVTTVKVIQLGEGKFCRLGQFLIVAD
ncbi:SGNH/GDSL hydrolase family protein [Pontiella agarivorans]|uniref:SGNH/GDSL hydrolase family protein n=1 Tax=Pontiella agarivorans TaxID=3038953 RepID=A0ABU5MX45_9BACT|nr:SGNH/GDSL hydrolase family protein [Pontiella agarivorans]MDZ8118775.1 SGNH/GDSL hydrolase family protein [Pontiella agarivorans]